MKPTSKYSLYNTENYNKIIHNTSHEILTKLIEVIVEYMDLISEKIMIKNKQYFVFIFERGIETIIHVFSMIFYYTKNLELTFFHSQKAYYFYIEFIVQISDDNITFLQLNSKDAVLFVYKKKIYDLNNEYKKNINSLTNDESIILSYNDEYIIILKQILSFFIHHQDFKYENNKAPLEYIKGCCNNIQTLGKYKIKKNYIQCVSLLTNLLISKQYETLITKSDTFFNILENFIKQLQIKKKNYDENKITKNIYTLYNLDKFENLDNYCKLIEHIFENL